MTVTRPCTGYISQGYSSAHLAVDIADKPGTDIVAPVAGKITIASNLGDCGLAVQVGSETNGHRLCHNSKLLVKVGQTVKQGQKIAEMGYTGYTIPAGPAGSHCHWVMWLNGVRVDGDKYTADNDDVYNGKTAKQWYQEFLTARNAANFYKAKRLGLINFLKTIQAQINKVLGG